MSGRKKAVSGNLINQIGKADGAEDDYIRGRATRKEEAVVVVVVVGVARSGTGRRVRRQARRQAGRQEAKGRRRRKEQRCGFAH